MPQASLYAMLLHHDAPVPHLPCFLVAQHVDRRCLLECEMHGNAPAGTSQPHSFSKDHVSEKDEVYLLGTQ